MEKKLQKFSSVNDLKKFLATNYLVQVKNYFANEKQAMKFLSSVMTAVQSNPDLLNCEPTSLVNSFMTMAQAGLMPSNISGEAYVLPYNIKGCKVAQFQLGYQGLVTLFYRASGQKIRAEIVRENDQFTYTNGEITHTVDIFKSNDERGKPVGAYAIATVNGQEIAKAMNAKDIMGFGEKFSKSFKSEYSPWNPKNDPELTMWKKTVLKQLGKMLPKNETINRALATDNQDSVMADRIEAAKNESKGLTMGSVLENKTTDIKEAEVVESVEPTYEPVDEKPATPPAPETPAKKAMREAAEKAKDNQ